VKRRQRVLSPRFVVVHRGPGGLAYGWFRLHPGDGYRFTRDQAKAATFRSRRVAEAVVESCYVREHPVHVEQL
jgi:hypothetical protein